MNQTYVINFIFRSLQGSYVIVHCNEILILLLSARLFPLLLPIQWGQSSRSNTLSVGTAAVSCWRTASAGWNSREPASGHPDGGWSLTRKPSFCPADVMDLSTPTYWATFAVSGQWSSGRWLLNLTDKRLTVLVDVMHIFKVTQQQAKNQFSLPFSLSPHTHRRWYTCNHTYQRCNDVLTHPGVQ